MGARRRWAARAAAGALGAAAGCESDAFSLTESAATDAVPLPQPTRPRSGREPTALGSYPQDSIGEGRGERDPWALPYAQCGRAPAAVHDDGRHGLGKASRQRGPASARRLRRYATAAQRRVASAAQQRMCVYPANRTKTRSWRLQTDVRALASTSSSAAPAELCWVEPCSRGEAARLRRAGVALATPATARSAGTRRTGPRVVSAKLPPRARASQRPVNLTAGTAGGMQGRGGAALGDDRLGKGPVAEVLLSTPEHAVERRTPSAPRGRKPGVVPFDASAPTDEPPSSTAVPAERPPAASTASGASALSSWGGVFNTPRHQ